MKTLLAAVCLASVALGGCGATIPPFGMNARACGDPCANVSCPSAFVCVVDGRCVARCQAEPFKPGMP